MRPLLLGGQGAEGKRKVGGGRCKEGAGSEVVGNSCRDDTKRTTCRETWHSERAVACQATVAFGSLTHQQSQTWHCRCSRRRPAWQT